MIFRILIAILLLSSTAWGQIELRPDKEWYRPDTVKPGKIYRNLDKDFKVVMGDTTLSEMKPSFTLQAFSDQPIPASMKLHMMNTDPDSNWVRGDSFYAKDSFVTHRTYMKSETEFEWEIILQKKSKTNVFTYEIETENFDFFYQDETTDVPGSYAVYHSSKMHNRTIINGNDTTYENYLTGKGLQIPRPTVWDATGDSIGAFQVFDAVAGVMRMVVDSVWLNRATRPVTIGPTFGFDGIGGSFALSGGVGFGATYGTYTASTGDEVTKYSIYTDNSGGVSTLNMGTFTVTSNLPDVRLAAGAAVSIDDATPAWRHSSAVSQALSNGVEYCVAMGDDDGSWDHYFDALVDGISKHTDGTLPATWSHNGYVAKKFSMYATYTTGVAAQSGRRRKLSGGG